MCTSLTIGHSSAPLQIPALPEGCASTIMHRCFSWQWLMGVERFNVLGQFDDNSPFNAENGMWTSLTVFLLSVLQARLYESASFQYIRKYYITEAVRTLNNHRTAHTVASSPLPHPLLCL